MVLNTKKMEEQVFDEPRFELFINIICQRGFNIRDYDEKFTDVVESNEVRQFQSLMKLKH
jgi:hypothetical protein